MSTNKNLSNQAYLKKGIELTKDYFLKSNERHVAWLILIGAIISVMALAGLIFAFSWWTAGFWAALSAKDFALFIASMKMFTYLAGGYVSVSVLKNYLVETLGIRWRNWLTQKLINQYISGDNNYLELSRLSSQIDNPAQRIQEDVQSLVTITLTSGLDLLKSTLTLAIFIRLLWVIGGALSFVLLGASITIPGYLVWCAIIFAATASFITHKIGHTLAKLTNTQKSLEADFRKDMESLSNDSESIAQEHGESYYKRSLIGRFREICKNAYQKLRVKTNLVAFENFYLQISAIFPYIVAAPLFFTGRTTLGALMQIAYAFKQVELSLSWFINSYEPLATYRASLGRIIELEHAFKADGLQSSERLINIKENDAKEALSVKNLNITAPTSRDSIMRGLNLKFNRHENTLIKGPSGLGKSTLLKVVAGTWKYGTGDASVPNYRNSFFLPQKPSLPNDTLRAVLAYPEPVNRYTKEQYIKVLYAVGNMVQFIDELDTKSTWSKRLSPGQQQRISFARALLKKPEWLFLDESTSSLDPASEQHLYNLVKNQLKNTTLISIAHRPTVDQFHDRVITLETGSDKTIHLNDQRITKNHTKAANAENIENLITSPSMI